MTKEYLTWDDIHAFVDKVADNFKVAKPTGVYGLPRGGLVLAVMLSHKLEIPLLMAPCKGCIIVDDIVDSGQSLLHYYTMGYYIATVMYSEGSPVIPNVYYKKRTSDWVVFPFECNPQDTDKDAEAYYNAKESKK